MNNNRDAFEVIKERIKAEAKHGDRTQACKDVGTTMTTYRTAVAKEKLSDLSDIELRLITRLEEILETRKAITSQLEERYAAI